MRESTGARTEPDRRFRSIVITASAVGAAAALLVATPADTETAASVRTESPRVAQPALHSRRAEVHAVDNGTDIAVREIDVPEDGTTPQMVARLRRSTAGFSLVALTWRRGTAPPDLHVQVRTRGAAGWSRWQGLHDHSAEGPAPGQESDGTRDGTEPLWVGEADGVEARVYSARGTAPEDLEVTLVDPGSEEAFAPTPARSTDVAGGAAVAAAPAVLTTPSAATTSTVSTHRPRLVSRRKWGANPRFRSRCDSPRRARTVEMTFVHHTVGSNRYSRRESPAIVRSVYAYHTQGRGWCDIGYNFLVDRFGTAYVGRAGGPNTPVRGAHAGDYNTGTVGVSLMGNFDKARPSRAMKRRLTQLLAWKLSSYYRAPKTTARVSGRRFEKISGHRDAMSTACPGRHVYRWLPRLRNRVARRAGRIDTPISRKWHALRRHGTKLGQPFRGEAGAAGSGRKTQFGRGWVYWNKRPGAHPVRGAIYYRYRRYGAASGRLGYPRSDTWKVKRHLGKGQTFQRGRIYRHPASGAAVVWGGVNRRYARTGLASGRLGVPVRNQYRIRRGWAGKFQHGRITWNTSTGRTRVRYRR